MVAPLEDSAIDAALVSLPEWSRETDGLSRVVQFGDFQEALAFIVRVGFLAEQQNHHPAIFNIYNRVRLALSTHDAGDQITERDIALAREIEKLLAGD